MEIICRILQQYPLSSTEYTDRQGQQKTFNAIGFELASGADTIYAELTGDQALRLASSSTPTLSDKFFYKAELTSRADSYQTQDGEVRRQTRIYINRITLL